MNDSDIMNNVEILSNHYIERFKQLLDNEQQKDAMSIMQEYVCNGEVEKDDYQWFYVNYQFKFKKNNLFNKFDSLKVHLEQPLRIEKGSINMKLPGMALSNGMIPYNNISSDIEPSGRQINIGLEYQMNPKENIAFGIKPKDIDQAAVEKASKIANLHEFVINNLPKKYQTSIGERGIRLSGGQRQRIGIARAMYHNPKLLILDEATNAVDTLTEKAIMEEVYNIGKDLTIIMIAHRLSTVMKCDKIFLLEKGSLIKQGTYKELKQFSDLFNEAPIKN